VILWATWCGPCKQELPYVQRWWDALADQGLRIFAVATDRDPAVVPPFLQENDYTFPVLLGGQQQMRDWGVTGIPAGFLVSPDGNVHASWRGFDRGHLDSLGETLESLVTGGPEANTGSHFARWTGTLQPSVRWLHTAPGIQALGQRAGPAGREEILAGLEDGSVAAFGDRPEASRTAGFPSVGPRSGGQLEHVMAGDEPLLLSRKRRASNVWLARSGAEQSIVVHASRQRVGGLDLGDLTGDGVPELAVGELAAGGLVLRNLDGSVLWQHEHLRGIFDVLIQPAEGAGQVLVLLDDKLMTLGAEGETIGQQDGMGGYRGLQRWEDGYLFHDRGVSEVSALRRPQGPALMVVRAARRVSVFSPGTTEPLLVLEVEAGEVDAAGLDLDGDGTDELVLSSSEFGLLALDLPVGEAR